MADDPRKEVVRRGYDALSQRYEEAFGSDTKYRPWLADLNRRLPPTAHVLDLGCGCGVPVARDLTAAGHRVTGVDISDEQVRRARVRVPDAAFVRGDAATVDFPPASFDAVVALYTLIHLPLDEQPSLLGRIATWLRPDGWFLATTGQSAWTGTDENWLGSGTAMWWSHADADTYATWLREAGLVAEHREFVPEGDGGHALFRARRAATAGPAG